MRWLLGHPFITHVLIYYVTALVLAGLYLSRTPVDQRQQRIVLWLVLFPSVGLGLWRHAAVLAAGTPHPPPAGRFVFSRMGTLHALLIGLSFLFTFTLVFTDWQVHEPFGEDSIANQSGNAAGVGFDLMLTGIESMAMLLIFFFFLLTYAFFFFLVSGIPWIIGGFMRRSHESEVIRRLSAPVPGG